MKKLSLKIESLEIESFATDTARNVLGTVHGNETEAGTCWAGDSCWSCDTENDQCSGMNTLGQHCGPQSTMNPLWSQCVTATMAGVTCEGNATCTIDCS